MKSLLILLFSLFLYLEISAQNSPCSNEKFRAFDFWIGDWRVETTEGRLAGYNHVEILLDSCVIVENWTGAGPSRGKSLNHYDWVTKKWKQKWVDNFANNLEFIGEVANDTATYFCISKSPQTGENIFNRMMIAKVSNDEVHQVWHQSKDSLEWTLAFEGKYFRIKNRNEGAINKLLTEVYSNFSKAYQTKDINLVKNLYADNATYLFGEDAIMVGKENITKSFDNFFSYLKENNTTANIEFKFLNRTITETLASDVGYYLLTYTEQDGTKKETAGKFVTVLQKQSNGKWQFISDTYNQAPVEAFKALK